MLVVEYDIAFTNFRLPPLTLQPLVENSVKHGMDPDAEPLHISIRTRHVIGLQGNPAKPLTGAQPLVTDQSTGNLTDSGTEIIVKDNGRGFDPSGSSEPGIALENIRQRIEMMCGGSLAITPADGGGTMVTVTIPDSAAK
jgi:sensor histidine kinase YesM